MEIGNIEEIAALPFADLNWNTVGVDASSSNLIHSWLREGGQRIGKWIWLWHAFKLT